MPFFGWPTYTLAIEGAQLERFVYVLRHVDRRSRKRTVAVTQCENRHRAPVRRRRRNHTGDARKRSRALYDLPGCLMVRMPHSPNPRLSPRQQRLRFDLRNQPRDIVVRVRRAFDARILKVEKTNFAAENAAGFHGVDAPFARDVACRKRTQRLRHLAMCEKSQDYAVPGCRMRR